MGLDARNPVFRIWDQVGSNHPAQLQTLAGILVELIKYLIILSGKRISKALI